VDYSPEHYVLSHKYFDKYVHSFMYPSAKPLLSCQILARFIRAFWKIKGPQNPQRMLVEPKGGEGGLAT
jgi:hypothetical protein